MVLEIFKLILTLNPIINYWNDVLIKILRKLKIVTVSNCPYLHRVITECRKVVGIKYVPENH